MQRRSVRALWWLSRCRADDVDVGGGLVAASVDVGAAGLVFAVRAFDHAGFHPDSAGGQQVGQDVGADDADQVDDGVGDDPGGVDELVAGGVQGGGEAGPVGVEAGPAVGGVDHGGAQELVDDE